MRSRLLLGSLTAIALSSFVSLVACGGSDATAPGEFDNGGFGSSGSSGSSGGEGTSGGLGGSSSGGTNENGNVNNACATTTAAADKLPLHMVVVLDRSYSMCIYNESNGGLRDCNNGNSRWKQVTGALATFFGAQDSSGITASLIRYSASGVINGNNTLPPADCTASSYTTPVAASVPLPDTTTLPTALNNLTGGGGTPTRPALEGAVQYAQGVQTQLAGKGKVVLLLATDGLPEYCTSNSIQDVANVAAGVAATIPTYVIGVGQNLSNLQTVAQAGGTTAFIIDTANPSTQISQQFGAAMAAIRGASLGCEYAIPAAPSGQTLDFNKVNVQYTPGGGTATTLTYSADCSNGQGWRYDNPTSPTKIMLCDAVCNTAKGDVNGKVDVVLGCQTQGLPPS